jgi:hypothetical protein
MAIKFRPRVGPFMWVSNGPGMTAGLAKMMIFLVKITFIVGVIWPFQLVWFVTLWTVQAVVQLVRYIGYQYLLRTQTHV